MPLLGLDPPRRRSKLRVERTGPHPAGGPLPPISGGLFPQIRGIRYYPSTRAALERLFHISVVYIALSDSRQHIRPYYPDSTISRPICEVKQGQVWLVLAWGTSWEVQMLYIFLFFSFFLNVGIVQVPVPPRILHLR